MYPITHLFIGWSIATVTAIALLIAGRRIKTAALVFVSFHIHLLCDIVGSKGIDGYNWPIPYLYPLSQSLKLAWDGQWLLTAWPNVLTTALTMGWMFYIAAKRGYSPIEMISKNADAVFVRTVRRRLNKSALSHGE